jgi:hypothetical protein
MTNSLAHVDLFVTASYPRMPRLLFNDYVDTYQYLSMCDCCEMCFIRGVHYGLAHRADGGKKKNPVVPERIRAAGFTDLR